MFNADDRERVRERLVEKARHDDRVAAAAAVGSSAVGGDRWSDLDLAFGVAVGEPVEAVLADWTHTLVADFGAAVLFDLPVGATTYRVFLLPGALQVDLSFAPVGEFGALGPRFRLLFGEAVERPRFPPASAVDAFGLGVHHAVRAHVCIARGRPWQAEYWLHEARDKALTLACLRRGLDGGHGRGFDALPPEVRAAWRGALAADLTAGELGRALRVVVAGLLREAGPDLDPDGRVGTALSDIR